MSNIQLINKLDTMPFKHHVMAVGYTPSSFDDSLSYAEQLTWLTKYICEVVIPTVNQDIEITNELASGFNEIKEIVEKDQKDIEQLIKDFADLVTRLNQELQEMKEYVDNEILTSVSNMETLLINIINTKFNQVNNKLDNEVERLDNKIETFPLSNTQVLNPYRGYLTSLQVYINDASSYQNRGAITAGEYDALELTASEYDDKEITAYDYDFNGKEILTGFSPDIVLYDTTGQHEDGAMTQKATTDALNAPNTITTTGDFVNPEDYSEDNDNLTLSLTNTYDNRIGNIELHGLISQNGTPTASNPVNIDITSGLQTITIDNGDGVSNIFNIDLVGKNKFHVELESGSFDPVSGKIANNHRIRTEDFINVQPSTKYTFNTTNNVSSPSLCIIFAFDENGNEIEQYPTSGWGEIPFTFTTGSSVHKIMIVLKTQTEMVLTPSNFSDEQLELGATATSYAPYYEIKIGKIGNYENYIKYENNKFYLHKEIDETTDSIGSTQKTISGMKPDSEIYSYCGGTVSDTTITYSEALSVDNIIYYVLNESTDVEITDSSIDSNLTNFYKYAKTFSDETNITINGNLPSPIKFKHLDFSKIAENTVYNGAIIDGSVEVTKLAPSVFDMIQQMINDSL